jgi:hypothetical protein
MIADAKYERAFVEERDCKSPGFNSLNDRLWNDRSRRKAVSHLIAEPARADGTRAAVVRAAAACSYLFSLTPAPRGIGSQRFLSEAIASAKVCGKLRVASRPRSASFFAKSGMARGALKPERCAFG